MRGVRCRWRTVRFAVLSFGVVVLATGFVAPASAQAPAVPAALTKEFQAGVDAYRLGKYDDARGPLPGIVTDVAVELEPEPADPKPAPPPPPRQPGAPPRRGAI